MKNKAELYKQQDFHRKDLPNLGKIINFKVLIGTYEKNRAIIINANGVHGAIEEAKNYLRSDEDILQVSRDDIILWKHPYL